VTGAACGAQGDAAVALCAHGEAAWHRLGLAALERASHDDDGLWWRSVAVSPLFHAAVTLRPGPAALPPDLAPGSVRDSFGALDLPAPWVRRPAGPWMLRDPAPLAAPPVVGLDIERVVNPDEIWVFERTAVTGAVGAEQAHAYPPYSIHGRESGAVAGLHLLLGRLDGEPVATAVAARWPAGVYVTGVTTVAAARRRGVGTAMTAAAVATTPGLPAVLCTSPAGAGVYARLGFREAGRGADWERSA
jgi:GNAT superfamily N-acetyltransferase